MALYGLVYLFYRVICAMKIPARYANVVFSFLMSLTMGSLMSGLVTAFHTGLTAGFLFRWIRAFSVAWPIAFCCVLLLAAPLRKLALKLTAE